MTEAVPPRWEDDYSPHDAERAAAQLQGVRDMLAPAPKRILDLGCGDGRLLIPLAVAGHHVVGIDRGSHAIEHCKAGLGEVNGVAELIRADFTDETWPVALDAEPFDAVLCVGNTFMTLWDVGVALRVVRQCARRLVSGGVLVLDDFPHDLWTELTEGNWQSGVSVDGAMQMVWEPGDAVFAIRHGEAVDEGSWSVDASDEPLRLWSMGALSLLAHAAALSVPEHRPGDGLILMRTSDSPSG